MGTVAILHVEDDDVDAELMRRTLVTAGVTRPLVRVRDGREALAIIRGDGRPPMARPYVVLLDLRMPEISGTKALEALRADPATSDLRVFVLSTSCAERHQRQSYELGAAGYLVKTDDQQRLLEIARLVDTYCEIVSLL